MKKSPNKPLLPIKKELKRELIGVVDGRKIEKVTTASCDGVFATANEDIEVEGTEAKSPELMEAMMRALYPPNEEAWQYYATKFPESLQRTRKFLQHIESKDCEKAQKAAVYSAARLNEALDVNGTIEDRIEAAFIAGEYYAKAMAHLSDRDALHGRKAKKAAEGTRKRKKSLIMEKLQAAWADFKEEDPKSTKTEFLGWLKTEGPDVYELEVEYDDSIHYRAAGEKLSWDYAKKRLKEI